MSLAEPVPERRMSLSEILTDLCDGTHAAETLGQTLQRFGRRSFGVLLFVLAAPNMLPLPPGSSTFLGAPLVLFTPQLAAGVKTPWLPAGLKGQVLDMGQLRSVFARLIPRVAQVERVSTARLTFLFGPVGDRVIGAVCTLLALVLMLPLPLGNLLPATAISLFGLALVQRDGILALAGYAVAAASFTVLALAAGVIHRVLAAALAAF
ncbi:exopolysaccharide biosynthesis protein [Phenylobacterium sp.]|uniref:exopolysaccharide biosynthesis protein n=1 Tax=Phenylobacterium sp. TaxID=1871053 RepID=UPI00260701CD|nr:exopolysaccharide biosynthesis protein [Phenylobacterium sp.]